MIQKQTLYLVILLVVCAASLYSAPVQQESAKEIFEKAIFLEESKGDLEGAIELFQKVVTNFPAERTTAAQALFHIGICYEKLGMREAQKAFQNVIDSYPDQSETVKLARAKLAVISRTKAAPQAEVQGFGLKQVWTGAGVDAAGAVSPDGRYLAITDWNTGDLAVRDIAAGKNRRITDKGPWIKSQAFALFPKWSHDGQSIAYSWFNPEGEFFDLHVVGLNDSKPKAIYVSNAHEYIQPFDYHPDGQRVLVGFYKEGDLVEIGFVSVKDGSVQVIKTFQRKYDTDPPWGFVISPDGLTIAYDNLYQKEPKTRDIFLLSVDGTEERRLIAHPAIDFVLDWTADGRHMLFGSERSGTTDMYVVRIDGGETVGDPILIKSNLAPHFSLGCTQQDQFFYGIQNSSRDIYVAVFDPESGEFLGPPEKQPLVYEGRNAYPDYSPDGKSFVYISFRSSLPNARNVICIRSLASGEIRDLDPGLGVFSYPQWRPDGKAISVLGTDKDDRKGIYLIDVRSEEVVPLVQIEETERISGHRWSTDGSTLFFTKSKTRRGNPSIIYTLNVRTGQIEALPGSPEDARDIDVSPDGKWLVFLNRRIKKRIMGIIPVHGGEAQELHTFDVMGEFLITPSWTPDGKYIYFSVKDNPADEDWDMWRFSLDTRRAEQLSLKTVNFRHPSIHPDGRSMIFSTEGALTHSSGVWMIENFLPKEGGKK